jgi:Methyltransferase domain
MGPMGPYPRARFVLVRTRRFLRKDRAFAWSGDLGSRVWRGSRDSRPADPGHRTVGLDASPTLVRYASAAHPLGRYVVGDAGALPFGDGTFDVVVAYNSLMDMDDMPGAM